VTVYLPLAVFVIVLLFPFYWMAITSVKPDAELLSREGNPFWVIEPTLDAFLQAAVRDVVPAVAVEHGAGVGGSTFVSLAASVFAAYAIERLRFTGSKPVGLSIFLAYMVPPSILFIPLAERGLQSRPLRHALGADPHLPDLPHSLLHLAADGLLPLDPGRARGVRAHRRREPLADPGEDRAAAGGAGTHLGRHLRLHAVVERVHLRADLHLSRRNKTMPVGVVTELVRGDVYQWGPLMAGALLGSLPVAFIYSFFVEYYVSSMTGSVKE
jgi:multiple sugar transport system permease protein